MKVQYIHESPLPGGGKQSSNIMWERKWPMKGGKFPDDHPCVFQEKEFMTFKKRGYWANPFPEGDGITLDPQKGQNAEKVVEDIKDCLGWEVSGAGRFGA